MDSQEQAKLVNMLFDIHWSSFQMLGDDIHQSKSVVSFRNPSSMNE